MPHHEIFLKLVEGKVVPNPRSIRCKPLDTLEFSSEDGEVKIIFKPGGAVDPGPPGFKQATVKEVPFLFGCQLKLPNGAVVGWGQLGQGEAGGCGKTEPPTISEV